nr:DNA (cytosine-5-)-methyltransferase [Paenibacillus sp. BK033]
MFAGIGGFRSALDPLGVECVFASEIDPFATKSYRALYNGAPELHGDITKINEHDIPDHDVLVGGFPCQAFSVAGQRKGFEDARGTLFFEIARIAAVKQPRLMLLENVKGLLSHDGGHTLEVMASVLNDIGYAIDFRVLNSKHYGVPQNRERIFIVCSRDAEHADWSVTGTDVVAKAKRRIQTLGVRTFNFDWPTNDNVTTRLRDVLEQNVDERYYLSEEKAVSLITRLNSKEPLIIQRSRGFNKGSEHQVAPPLTSHSYEQNNHVVEPQLEQYSEGNGIAYNVDANYSKGTSLGDIGKGRRTHIIESVALTERRSDEAKAIRREARKEGRDFSPRRGKILVPREDGLANCVTATQTVEQTLLEQPLYRIRKLTPLECWRLQGFSDAAHNTVATAGISDSQRYKQAGNAVTVNVISAIGKRLIPLLNPQEVTV